MSAAPGPALFASAPFSDIRDQTGSHVDVKGFSAIVGAAYGIDVAPGKLTLGGFLEHGAGEYQTFNDFANFASVKGEGDAKYFGGGLLARLDVPGSAGTTYLEMSARLGRVSADFATNDLGPASVSYDASSNYYGFHAGLGHVFNLAEETDLNLYGKAFWTRQMGKTVHVPDPIVFDAVSSVRARAGARLSHGLTETVSLFAGAAFEREFGGEANATIAGSAVDVPKLKGSAGIGELGLAAKIGEGATLEFGVQGYAGDRQGFSGSVKLDFAF